MPSKGGSPCSTLCCSRMSAYSIGKMSAEPRHSDVVSVSGAGFPASVQAREAADAAERRAASTAAAVEQRHDDEEQDDPDERRNASAARPAPGARTARRNRRLQGAVDRESEFAPELLRDAQRAELDPVAVVLALEVRNHLVAD